MSKASECIQQTSLIIETNFDTQFHEYLTCYHKMSVKSPVCIQRQKTKESILNMQCIVGYIVTTTTAGSCRGGPLVLEVGHKKFTASKWYTCVYPLGCKNMQNWRKGSVFGHVHKFWKGHDGKNYKKTC